TLRQWGDEWISGAGNEPTELEHLSCGHRTIATMTCDHCGEPLVYEEIRPVPGPGLDGGALLLGARIPPPVS
ncbi:MAG: transcriptional regulator, partial [Acidimicrobiales bacterium]